VQPSEVQEEIPVDRRMEKIKKEIRFKLIFMGDKGILDKKTKI
jgi:hypothetical protein